VLRIRAHVGSVPTRVADQDAAGTRQALRREIDRTKLFRFSMLRLAERVGFVHARDAPKARRGLTEDTLDAKTERK
jgi:hypothetical protein